MKKTIGSALVSLAMLGTTSAAGLGVGVNAGLDMSTYSGNGSGYASSATTGGGMASTTTNHTGLSVQHSSNQGGNYATAGVLAGPKEVTTYTSGGTTNTALSGGFTTGSATGTTAGAVGNDYSSKAFASFQTSNFGGTLGGFGTIGVFVTP